VSVTYRFEMVSERSDGKRTVAQRSAAVYETLEEALLQAGTDELISANVRPVDIIDGAHHGYEITAWGEPVADVDPATADSNPKDATKLAGRKDIGRAAAICGHPRGTAGRSPPTRRTYRSSTLAGSRPRAAAGCQRSSRTPPRARK
jgi:hypothetical protein